MNDPRCKGEEGARVYVLTYCTVGNHVFAWTGKSGPPDSLRCSCAAYTYREWKELNPAPKVAAGVLEA